MKSVQVRLDVCLILCAVALAAGGVSGGAVATIIAIGIAAFALLKGGS